jgi:hypothetical protein
MSLSHRHVCGHGEAAVDSLTPIAASVKAILHGEAAVDSLTPIAVDSVSLERVRRREIKKERQRNKN